LRTLALSFILTVQDIQVASELSLQVPEEADDVEKQLEFHLGRLAMAEQDAATFSMLLPSRTKSGW
jgi:alpha-D-ribose 1-methylphosphonate 5-triphosphate synthase subunit PhnH